jgi:hypothetical protein
VPIDSLPGNERSVSLGTPFIARLVRARLQEGRTLSRAQRRGRRGQLHSTESQSMFRLRNVLFAVIGASVMMAAVVGTASARTLSSSSQTLRAAWREMVFTPPAGGSVACNVTLEGSLHSRAITKALYSLIGYITRADLGACVGGQATILRETLPWHVKYEAFAGTLPNITSIRALIIGASFRVHPEGSFTCLFRTTDAEHASGRFNREAGGALTSAEVGPSEITSTEACAFGFRTRGTLTGNTTSLTALNSASRITVTLI